MILKLLVYIRGLEWEWGGLVGKSTWTCKVKASHASPSWWYRTCYPSVKTFPNCGLWAVLWPGGYRLVLNDPHSFFGYQPSTQGHTIHHKVCELGNQARVKQFLHGEWNCDFGLFCCFAVIFWFALVFAAKKASLGQRPLWFWIC